MNRRRLAGLAAIAAAPLVCLLVLALTGQASSGPALAAAALVAAASGALAVLWDRDLDALSASLRAAAAEDVVALAAATAATTLPPHAAIARGIERLARAHTARAADIGALLRANAAIVEHLPDPLLVLGADGILRHANAAARAAFGADMPSVLRHPVMRNAIDQALDRRATQIVDLTIPVPTPREVQATVILLDPPMADGGHAVAVLSDRTRDRAVERMRADFVANASHELRTPLASLIGFIATLQGPAADDLPAQRRFLGIMAEQAERMNRLIDDLLSLSRIELVEHQPPSDAVDLAQLAHAVAAGFEPRLAARQTTLALDIAEGLPPAIADADQIAQVLTNLVDNAMKYGREGGTVRLRVGAPPPGGRWPSRPGLVLSVTDDGPGIPRAQVPRLTERFYRVDKARSRATPGGTGLGLSIVRHIVTRHRGQLAIESDTGKGASFSVWLPVSPGS